MRWNKQKITGWGRAVAAECDVARPEKLSALKEISTQAPAPAIGQLRSYGDAALNKGGRVVDMTRLNRIIGFDSVTGIVTVEAGVPIGELGRLFAGRGWIPAVMPGTGFATVGGCIANDVHGKNHHVLGSFGQHVVELTLVVGGKRKSVGPEKTPDLFRATVGGLGQTGPIVEAKLQLIPARGDMMLLTERRMDDWHQFIDSLDNSTADYAVGWIDATAKGAAMGRGILEEGEITSGISPDKGRSLEVPFNAPHWALSAPVVRLFNELYFRRVPETGRTSVKPISAPFFPLDKLHNWNRLYGKRGFHQFQCVVPLAAEPALKDILERVSNSGLASPLAVLKRMGSGRAGFMSFPMEGYTLAVDFPNRDAAVDLIRSLEESIVEAGGRIYFAKDALGHPEHIEEMYPEIGKWRKTVAKADAKGQFATDLVRRLNLRSDL